jgi:hypothetical protein
VICQPNWTSRRLGLRQSVRMGGGTMNMRRMVSVVGALGAVDSDSGQPLTLLRVRPQRPNQGVLL